MIRVFIADDHPIVRNGLQQILMDANKGIIAAGEAEDGPGAVSAVIRGNYDVVVLDMKLPGMNGLEVLKQIKTHKPEIKVLMLTMYPEEQYAVRAFRAGAAGYVNKADDPAEIMKAIQKVAGGGKYVSPSMAEKFVEILDTDTDQPLHASLSDREFQVVRMIGEGKTVSEIADELFLSVKTVSTYRSRILEKMHMKNNAELMAYALRNGLVE